MNTTYLAHAMSLSALHGPGPWPDGGAPLPDEEPEPGPGQVRFAPGALDGIVSQHGRGAAEPGPIAELADLIQASDLSRFQQLHDRLAELSTLDIADPLSEELRRRDAPAGPIRRAGRWLAEHGTRRGAVAAGIVLLGLAGDDRDRELLLVLGGLEELALYAAVALARSQPDPEAALYALARRVDGWGRIHAVQRLLGTQDPQIRDWLLRGGFRNSIMDEYLAHLAATTGGLADALAGPAVGEELLGHAGDLLLALANGGPAQDMGDYPDGPVAVDRYLRLAEARPATLARIQIVVRLRADIAGSAVHWGWPADVSTRLVAAADALAARPDWQACVQEHLDSPDPATFRLASWIALRLPDPADGPTARERVMARLRLTPDDDHLWYSLVGDGARMDDVVALAEDLLPLAELATGPTTDVGLGFGGPDGLLDLIVSRLDRHPGLGWALIRVGLANRTIRNRNMAIQALRGWPTSAAPAEAVAAVRSAVEREPVADVRQSLRNLLTRLGG